MAEYLLSVVVYPFSRRVNAQRACGITSCLVACDQLLFSTHPIDSSPGTPSPSSYITALIGTIFLLSADVSIASRDFLSYRHIVVPASVPRLGFDALLGIQLIRARRLKRQLRPCLPDVLPIQAENMLTADQVVR